MPWDKLDSDALKTQIRRRVFWCCYNLDRAMSITLGRPQSITDGDIDVEVNASMISTWANGAPLF